MLPQVSAQAQLIHNIKVQNRNLWSLVQGQILEIPLNHTPPLGTVIAFPFQLKNLGGVTLNANQLLFDGSYFVGLRAAKTYKELSQNRSSQIGVAEAVTKAYYSVLVNPRTTQVA